MAIFNPFLPSFARNPYPAYAALRSSEPVHFSPALQAWVVTSFAECERVLREPETFSSNPRLATSPMARQFQQQRREFPLGEVPTVLSSDAPVHTRLRGIVSRAFTPRVIEGMRGRIEEITEELLGAVPAGVVPGGGQGRGRTAVHRRPDVVAGGAGAAHLHPVVEAGTLQLGLEHDVGHRRAADVAQAHQGEAVPAGGPGIRQSWLC